MIDKLIIKLNKWKAIGQRYIFTPYILKRLEQSSDVDIRNIATSINFILKKTKWPEKEHYAFQKIDKIRKTYLLSTEKVKIEDYGAGNSNEQRSENQMHDGVSEICSVSHICKSSSSPEKWGKLIFKLIRNFRPSNCLELGTCLGISAAYQVAALKLNSDKGKLTTIEGAGELVRISNKTLKEMDYPEYSILHGKFNTVLSALLTESSPFDFVFIDGHHDKVATIKYFNIIYPHLAEKCIIIFDDINWSKGMQEAWSEIFHDSRIKMSFDLYRWGICLIDKSISTNEVACWELIV